MDFSNAVRQERRLRRMSQAELGSKVGVSQVKISRVECGTSTLSWEVARRLAGVLDIDLNAFKSQQQPAATAS